MEFLKKLFAKKEQAGEKNFVAQGWPDRITLRRNDGAAPREIEDPSEEELRLFLQSMYDDADQFVVLTLPEARDVIRYVQACQVPEGIIVQLGIEHKGGVSLHEKLCSREETDAVFAKFLAEGTVEDRESFTEVVMG